jgi:hypothetical protein
VWGGRRPPIRHLSLVKDTGVWKDAILEYTVELCIKYEWCCVDSKVMSNE